MYKAVHSYTDTAAASHTLPFNSGEILCVLEKTNNTWWLASNSNGKIGYIPSAYVKLIETNSQDVVLQSIERAISAVYASATSDSLSSEQANMLRKLNQHKEKVVSSLESKTKSMSKRHAPPPPTRATDEDRPPPPPPQRKFSSKRQAPTIDDVLKSSTTHQDGDTSNPGLQASTRPHQTSENLQPSACVSENSTSLPRVAEKVEAYVPAQLGQELMSCLQENSELSDVKSRETIESLLMTVSRNISPLQSLMNEIIDTLPDVQITEDPGITKLKLALENIMEIKNDAQQRNWAIEDDREKISSILQEIMESSSSCDKSECISILRRDHCDYVVMLTVYYQMESRVAIRLLVLQIIGIICSLSSKFVSALMTTVLPHELVLDITDHTDDIERICYSALVLSMVFSTGEPIPLSYYDVIGEKFLAFLLDCIEEGLEEDTDDRCGDILVRLILAINLHFLVPKDNLTMKAICQRTSCTTLSEKVMLLVNRGDDPVRINEDEEDFHPPHSVLKFLQDIFSLANTAKSFLYTNDLFVLTDIMARNIADLPLGSKSRTDYLDLLLNVLARSSYHETKHRAGELLASLRRIKDEELPEEDDLRNVVEFDKHIVNTILEEHIDSLL